MNSRFLIVPVALAISTAFIGTAASPAMAAKANACATAPGQIRTVAATANPDQARKALTLVASGEKICAEGGDFEAAKKFSAAAKLLGTDMAALTTSAPVAQ